MRFLFIHQNFPGQFRHVARALAAQPEHQVIALGDERFVAPRPNLHPDLQRITYPTPAPGQAATHHYLRDHEGHVRRGQAVVRRLMALQTQQAFEPDVVMAHPGWGEALFLRDLFPRARHLSYLEFFYRAEGADVGFDPAWPITPDDRLRVRMKNNTQLHALVDCDAGVSPTHWQKSRYPAEFHAKMSVIHDGIDTAVVCPDPQAWVQVGDTRLQAGDEVVTYVARNLEPYRGFHTFMRMLPELQAVRPNAHVLVVGGDEVSYGQAPADGRTHRQVLQAELGDRVDWRRVHFLGRLPYADYLRVLQVSAAHVYLTYPFVLSWSMLEAMAAGCALVASDTAPVTEVIEDGVNGRLTGFFDPAALARTVAEVLAAGGDALAMRQRARQTVLERYDLQAICLPRFLNFLQDR